jgi:hypothetical protein
MTSKGKITHAGRCILTKEGHWGLGTGKLTPTGTDVMIFKIFSPKNSAKKMAFLTKNKAKICKILIITLVFEKHANLFSENCQKTHKIVIITSTPDKFAPSLLLKNCSPGIRESTNPIKRRIESQNRPNYVHKVVIIIAPLWKGRREGDQLSLWKKR